MKLSNTRPRGYTLRTNLWPVTSRSDYAPIDKGREVATETDWGFVTPVWILMGLSCVIAQVAGAQWLWSLLS